MRTRRIIIAGALAAFMAAGVLAVGHLRLWWAPDPPRDPNALVLRVRFTAGMGPAGARPVPDLSLYGDGRLIVTSLDLDRMPARELVRDMRLTDRAYREIYRDARLAGLGDARVIKSDVQVLDGGSTKITLLANGRPRVTTLESGAAGPRVWLIDQLLKRLALGKSKGEPSRSDLIGPARPYQPTRIALLAHEVPKNDTGTASQTSPAPQIRPWPLHSLSPGACTLHAGSEAATIGQLLESAPKTHWASQSRHYALTARPLLPDETDCASLPR
ncbi:hypothetical protein GCM10010411_42490 [Actinomadura fulvescens]|uniref:DUF4340 domain-containing protein n=1 Tax=Actinomadura fulvescens TaxID=46160 RepID=A0ABN3PWI9_9ACTN